MAAVQENMAAGSVGDFASGAVDLKELMAQKVHLGIIRELTPPERHMGLDIIPMMDVEADDVILDYLKGTGSGLAPAVSPDAESELFQDSEDITGQISASVVDWRLKSRYSWTDVNQFHEAKELLEAAQRQGGGIPINHASSVVEKMSAKMARDTIRRKLFLDNRLEWLAMTALVEAELHYDDGKVKFDVDYKRPADQKDRAPQSTPDYSGTGHDPINDFIAEKQRMFDIYGVDMEFAYCSSAFANSLFKSAKFIPRTGFTPSAGVDPRYVLEGWGPRAAIEIIEREANIKLVINDNVFRQRDPRTGVITNIRYIPRDEVLFLPNEAQLAEFDDTELGFGKMLTSPHPMGNFQPGWYAWETETIDPWIHTIGTGIKAFPVLPHMELTSNWKVTLPPA